MSNDCNQKSINLKENKHSIAKEQMKTPSPDALKIAARIMANRAKREIDLDNLRKLKH